MTKTTAISDDKAPKVVEVRHHRMGDRVPWQRLALTLIGIGIQTVIWEIAVWHLYSLPVGAYSAFTTITVNCLYTISALIIFFVTGKLLYDWKNSTTTSLAATTQDVAQDVKQQIDEHRTVDETIREFNTPELQERYGDR